MYRVMNEKKVFEGDIIEVYGIKYYDKFYDISINEKFVQNMVNKFNRNKLSNIHLLDCIYDEIIDDSYILCGYLL